MVTEFDKKIVAWLPKDKRRELQETKTTIYRIIRKETETETNDDIFKQWRTIKSITAEQHGSELNYNSRADYFNKPEQYRKSFYKVKTGKEKLKKLNQFRLEYFNHVYNDNSQFKQLYDAIVDSFAKQISEDFINYKKGNLSKISLAAKWLPNPKRYFDKYLFILLPIARKFFDLEKCLFEDIQPPEKRNEDKLLIRLFQQVSTTLRRNCIKIPEIPMSAKVWDQVNYKTVPSVAMLKYKGSFILHDYDRFEKFLESNPLKGAALTPGDLVKEIVNVAFENDESIYMSCDVEIELTKDKLTKLKVVEKQWQSLIDDVKSKGLFNSCLTLKTNSDICLFLV